MEYPARSTAYSIRFEPWYWAHTWWQAGNGLLASIRQDTERKQNRNNPFTKAFLVLTNKNRLRWLLFVLLLPQYRVTVRKCIYSTCPLRQTKFVKSGGEVFSRLFYQTVNNKLIWKELHWNLPVLYLLWMPKQFWPIRMLNECKIRTRRKSTNQNLPHL